MVLNKKSVGESKIPRAFLPCGKKGATIGMVFIFIVAAVTFALIMIFGYKAIIDFVGKGEQVEFYYFKTDLETSTKRIYTEYGSVRVEEFRLPMNYEQICFVDLEMKYEDSCEAGVYGCDVWQSAGESYDGADENVFLDPAGPVQLKIYRLDLWVDLDEDNVYENGEKKGSLCVPIVNGKFSLRLEGRGDRTRISTVPRFQS